MAQSASLSSEQSRPTGMGTVLVEVLLLVITVVVSVVLVVMLTMARRSQLDSFGAQPYGEMVRDYLFGLLQGHLSGINTTPIKRSVMNRALVTAGIRSLQLLGVSLAVGIPLGLIWGGLLATVRKGRFSRFLYGANAVVLAVPSFVVLILLLEAVSTITKVTGVRIAYTFGYGFDKHLIVPVTVLALRGGAYLAQAVQVAQEDIMQQEWIRVARSKGLGGFRLWRQHTWPLLLLPLLGALLGMLRVVVGAMILVEYLFSWSGLSKSLLQIDQSGFLTYRPEPVEVGAAVLLVLFFVATDALGRLALWGVASQRQEVEASV